MSQNRHVDIVSVDLNAQRDLCKQFASDHLEECADELLEMMETAVLRDGRVRELTAMCAAWAGQAPALSIAESLVKQAALRAVAAPRISHKIFV